MNVFAALLVLALAVPAAGAPVDRTAARVVVPQTVDSEASLEYLISLAGALSKGDSSARIRALKDQLEALMAEQKALLAKIREAQRQVSEAEAAGDHATAQGLAIALQSLQVALANLESQTALLMREIKTMQEKEQQLQDEAKRGAETLRMFEAALLKDPPRDAYVKTLSPAARATALGKARKGNDALVDVAKVASLAVANANAAAADAAEKQRQLLAEKERLNLVQSKLDRIKLPTPTPTRPVSRMLVPVK